MKGKVEDDTVTTDKPSDKTYPWRPTKTDTQVYTHTLTHIHTFIHFKNKYTDNVQLRIIGSY